MTDADLTDISIFAAVAEQRSFRKAAALRNGSASTLSAGVRRLEERLGVRLLHRTTRSVTTTEAGEALLASVRPALAEIGRAVETAGGGEDRPRGTLRLNVPAAVSDTILPPILHRFLALYPDIRAEITVDNSFIDVLAAGFDAGIRFEESLAQDMIAVPIGPRHDRFMTVASPAYLAAHGVPGHPNDLIEHISVQHRFASGISPAWEYEKDGQTILISPPSRLVCGSVPMMVAGAEAGLGLAASFEAFFAAGVARGTLVPVLEDWSVGFSGPFLYYAGRRLVPAPLRAFVDFLRAEAGQAASLPGR